MKLKRTKISILTSNFSNQCLGRAYLLAEILRRHFEVEIVGPLLGKEIWKPLAGEKEIEYKILKTSGKLKLKDFKQLINLLEGEIIYASKPFFASFGIGVLSKFLKNKPLVLDIDDWEMGLIKERFKNFISRFKSKVYWQVFFCEKLKFLADEITVSNAFLQRKFGGTIIWHGRDERKFDPERFNKEKLREKYQTGKKKKIVMFFGTPRPYKGVEDLIEALTLVKEKNVILMVVGVDISNSYCKNLVQKAKALLKEKFIWFGLQPFEKVPEFLTLADVIVIPQRKTFATLGQMPAKVFDAMAMAKPIIATKVCDLEKVLEKCGYLVEPFNVKELAKTIEFVFQNEKEAKEKAKKAREKFLKNYSYQALERKMIKIFNKY